MWGVGEATCLLGVFCAPSAPAAFRGEGKLFSRLGQSFRSWVRITRGDGSSPDNSHGRAGWRSTAPPDKVFERTDDSSQVRLADLENLKMPQQAQVPVGDRGIMRTFEFSSEDRRYENYQGPGMQYQQQHPWTGHGV